MKTLYIIFMFMVVFNTVVSKTSGQNASEPAVLQFTPNQGQHLYTRVSPGQDVIVIVTLPKPPNKKSNATLHIQGAGNIPTIVLPNARGYFGFDPAQILVGNKPLRHGTYLLVLVTPGQRNVTVGSIKYTDERYKLTSGNQKEYFRTALRLASTAAATVPIIATLSDNQNVGSVGTNVSSSSSREVGTGVIMSRYGIIATCDHLIRNATSVHFNYHGQTFEAVPLRNSVTARWASSDIAILKVTGTDKSDFVTISPAAFSDLTEVQKFVNQDSLGPLNWVSFGYSSLDPTTLLSLNVEKWSIGQPSPSTSIVGFTYHLNKAFFVSWHDHYSESELSGMSGGPLVTDTGYVMGIQDSAATTSAVKSNAQGVFIPISSVVRCLDETAGVDSDIGEKWPSRQLVLSDDEFSSQIQTNKSWIDLLNGISQYSHNQTGAAATSFLKVISDNNRPQDNSKAVSSAALEALTRLGSSAVPEINGFLRSSLNGPVLPSNSAADVLMLSAGYDEVPRDILAQALRLTGSRKVQYAALTAVSSIHDLSLVTPKELDAVWNLAAPPPLSADTSLNPSGQSADDLAPFATYVLGRLLFNPQGTRYQQSAVAGLFSEQKRINDFIWSQLTNGDDARIFYAAKAIKDTKDMVAFNNIKQKIADGPDTPARVRLIDALGFIGIPNGADVLQRLVTNLGEHSDDVRHHAMLSLSKIATQCSLQKDDTDAKQIATFLQNVLLTQQSTSAEMALGRLGGPLASNALETAFFAYGNKPNLVFLVGALNALKNASQEQANTSSAVLDRIGTYQNTDPTTYSRLMAAFNQVFVPAAANH